MKLEMEELWELIFGVEKQPSPIPKINAATITPPTNQATISTWKKRDCIVLAAIWDCVGNSIFSYVGVQNNQ